MFDVKIITLGDGQVGKTSLINRFTEDKFNLNYLSTIGIDYKQKSIQIPGYENEIKVKIFDSAGQERYKCIALNYLKKANGILLVYDITDQQSFLNVKNWMDQIQSNLGDKIPIVLVGNKCDLEERRQVQKDQGLEKASQYDIKFFETSCQSGINVKEAFYELSLLVVNKFGKTEGDKEGFVLKKSNVNTKKKTCCKK